MLLPRKYKETKVYGLEQDYQIQTGIRGFVYAIDFVEIAEDGLLTIKQGYSWDGCTPKFAWFDMVWGTPEGIINEQTGKPKTYYASLVHDVLYQLSDFIFTPQERHITDKLFYQMLKAEKFRAARFYFYMARIFGKYYWGKQ